jgi:hypothetical protein
MTSDDDKKIKDLLDDATRAELERWFGLPSYQELEDKGVEIEDPDWAEARKKRAEALAAVDPELLEWHRRRNERDLLQLAPELALHVEAPVSKLDLAAIERRCAIAEPREVEIPLQLDEDLRACTPQALLRDLHRPELFFDKLFEIVDVGAEQRVDLAATIREALATRPSTRLGPSPAAETRAILREATADRRRPWAAMLAEAELPNRRWTVDERSESSGGGDRAGSARGAGAPPRGIEPGEPPEAEP